VRSSVAAAGTAVESALRGTSYQVHRRYNVLPYLTVTAPVAAIEKLRQSGRITGVQVDTYDYPTLVESVRIVGAAEATAHGTDGSGQVIAILDTGVDTSHSMFNGRIVSEACFSTSGHCPQRYDPADRRGFGRAVYLRGGLQPRHARGRHSRWPQQQRLHRQRRDAGRGRHRDQRLQPVDGLPGRVAGLRGVVHLRPDRGARPRGGRTGS